MDDNKIIPFPQTEEGKEVMACDQCGSVGWYITASSQVECIECGNQPEGLIWAFIMGDLSDAEH